MKPRSSTPGTARRRHATSPPTRRRRSPPPRRAAVRDVARESAVSVYRDAILRAAEDEFSERGYAATKMLDIARRAGMSVGALYRYFVSKEVIFASLVRRSSDRLIERMSAAAADVADPAIRLATLVRSMFAFIEEHRAMFLVLHQLGEAGRAHCEEVDGQADAPRERVLALYRAAIAEGVATRALRDDVAVDDQLAFLTGAIHGFLETWIRGGGETGLVDKAPLVTDLTLRALGGAP